MRPSMSAEYLANAAQRWPSKRAGYKRIAPAHRTRTGWGAEAPHSGKGKARGPAQRLGQNVP